MSRHWNPDEEIANIRAVRGGRVRSLDELTPPDAEISALPKKRWPQGATVGLLLVAAACAGTAVALYLAAGPRDVFAP